MNHDYSNNDDKGVSSVVMPPLRDLRFNPVAEIRRGTLAEEAEIRRFAETVVDPEGTCASPDLRDDAEFFALCTRIALREKPGATFADVKAVGQKLFSRFTACCRVVLPR